MVRSIIKVSFQGEKGAFSETAAKTFFTGKSLHFLPQTTFEQVFKSVKNKNAAYGVVPIENSLTGSIHQNYDLLLKYNLPICGEVKLRISHCLISHKNVALKQIKKVYSHPQALEQCKDFLATLKKVEVIPSYDTAGAVKQLKLSGNRVSAAIAGQQAARDYRMQVIKKGIENNHRNFTRFLFIGRQRLPQVARRQKTSIVFAPKRNIPGFLFRSLSVFALRDINLVKIESRPLHGKPWQYLFYLDFEGSQSSPACQNAIDHLKEITTFVRILGTYPQGRQVTAVN